ncbi:MAG: hypothetical protein ACLFVU_10640 [Phycisphaerae bacterium]
MIPKLGMKAYIGVGLGLFGQIAAALGLLLHFAPGFELPGWLGLPVLVALAVVATVVLVFGCFMYMAAKGYTALLGLLGVFSIVGVIGLLFFPDRNRDMEQRDRLAFWVASAALHVVIIVGVLIPFHEQLFSAGTTSEPDPPTVAELRDMQRRILESRADRLERQLAELVEVASDIQKERDGKVMQMMEARGMQNPPETLSGDVTDKTRAALAGDEKDVLEHYRGAIDAEKILANAIRQARAAGLASFEKDLTPKQALDTYEPDAPNRPAANEGVLFNPVKSMDDYEKFQNQMSAIEAETGAIISHTKMQLEKLRGTLSVDSTESAIDASGGGAYFTGGSGGSVEDGPSIGPPLLMHEYFPSDEHGGGNIRAMPGRKILKGNYPYEDWFYIDTWYIVGPFPNEGRRNLHHKFRPEHNTDDIDLNEQFAGGKGGRTLEWIWWQSSHIKNVPPHWTVDKYAIYYAFTEIYIEENPSGKPEEEYWVAIGSDDHCRLWVNGEKVFESKTTPKRWLSNEAFRPVMLKEGYNSIMMRVENAGGTMGFSLMVSLRNKGGSAAE